MTQAQSKTAGYLEGSRRESGHSSDESLETSGEVMVGLAEIVVKAGPANFAFIGLGSCVGCVALDPVANVAGAVHVMLPHSIEGVPIAKLGMFADTGIPELVRRMVEAGASQERICTAYAGGAKVSTHAEGAATYDIGSRNVESLRASLEGLAIPVIATDEGGTTCRAIKLCSATGEVIVRTIKQGEAVLCSLRAA